VALLASADANVQVSSLSECFLMSGKPRVTRSECPKRSRANRGQRWPVLGVTRVPASGCYPDTRQDDGDGSARDVCVDCRHCLGVKPSLPRRVVQRWLWLEKPVLAATSASRRSVSASNFRAAASRWSTT